MSAPGHGGEIGVVIATRNRRRELLATLDRLASLPERPPLAVVDNRSEDGSADAVARLFPAVRLLRLDRNRGAYARNLGAAALGTPLVAFCDDDSWWEPGSLARAAAAFERFPALGLIAARILVGEERRLDPTSAEMRGEAAPGLPGPEIDGFLACGAAVRRSAFDEAGGFCERFLIGGEETLLSLDMGAAGWRLCYLEDVTAIHMPHGGERADRSWMTLRNALWTTWLRMPRGAALRQTASLVAAAPGDPIARRALLSGLRGLPWAIGSRRARRGLSPRPTGHQASMQDDDEVIQEEEDAAAEEAGRIGGRSGMEGMDEAERAAAEHGGGEAEGFEEAEQLLEEQATHGDPTVDPLRDAGEVEEERDPTTQGEADEVDSTETRE